MVVSKTNMLFSRASEIMTSIEDQNNASSPITQLEVILRTPSGPGVNSSRLSEVPGLQVASSAASNVNQLKPKPKINRENDATVISGRVEVDGLKYRRRPNIKSDAIGQYPIGTKITITGLTREGTTVIKGDP